MTPLLFLTAFVMLLWARLALRSIRLALASPRLTGITGPPPSAENLPQIIAIVPAHNEENGISAIVNGVLRQNWPPDKLRLIVVNDQSTDRTGAILDELAEKPEFSGRLLVIHGEKRPPGWAGKTWAVHQGVLAARADAAWLWMIDSDMRLSPEILAVAWQHGQAQQADLVSLTAGVDATTVAQRSTALAMIHLLWQLYPLPYVNQSQRAEALAHGAFVLIRRQTYDKIGGIESLRQEIIEDIRLAQRVKASGGVLAVHAAPRLTRTDFYGSVRDILNGLRKNAYAGMDYMPHKFWTGLVFGILFTWLPLVATLLGFGLILAGGIAFKPLVLLAVGLAGLLFQAQSLLPIVIYLDLPKIYALSLPVGGSIYMYACWLSYWDFVRGRVVWRGRDFKVDELHANIQEVALAPEKTA
jgi:cellulose synthase/poly-beta-1,6-N-acetylglucosamine synthase-like glycosyltransferase